jgi:hypothetical protein
MNFDFRAWASAGVALGLVSSVLSLALDATAVPSLGMPSWIYGVIGLGLIFVSGVSVYVVQLRNHDRKEAQRDKEMADLNSRLMAMESPSEEVAESPPTNLVTIPIVNAKAGPKLSVHKHEAGLVGAEVVDFEKQPANYRGYIQELVHWDDHQKQQWRQYLSISLTDVYTEHLHDASPFITFRVEVRNHLATEVVVERVTDSSGSVLGLNLPPPVEAIAAKIPREEDRTFVLHMYMVGEDVPKAIQMEAKKPGPPALLWMLKGRWWVRVYGDIHEAWGPDRELTARVTLDYTVM